MSQQTEIQEDDFRPSAARLVESLRDTGYSREAAFADIIDNAIAANATKISIELQYMYGEFRVIITDNGDGMSESELLNAMRYGSERRANPKSLGKFGMGLKTASTAFCRRLVVLTEKDGVQSGRAWDIDRIISTDRWELETPDADDYYDDYEELSDFTDNGGTMIIWENTDRLIKKGSDRQTKEAIKSLGHEIKLELSAIFFKFLAEKSVSISMKIGEQAPFELKGWDPLCSDFVTSDGVRSRVLKEKIVPVDLSGNIASFSVKGSVIPSQNELNSDEQKFVRYSLDNQGFYIYREGRLIWHDGWPHRMYKKEGKVTRLRVELHFDHKLDDVFNIDFRKSRVIIPVEIREELKRLVSPWRQELLKGQARTIAANTNRAHGPADKAIDKHSTYTKNSELTVAGDTVTIRNQNQMKPVVIEGIRVYEDKKVRVHEEDSILGDELWEPSCDDEGNTCVTLGKSHPYFHKMYNVCKDNVEAMKALDMLLWSLANAEHGEYSEVNQHTLRGYRQKVSQTLRYLSIELPDAEEDE
ncbi:ATP-binding protein [Vibrio parahaemolyticus]|uniref:ATP-binding protein n=1 Tax=Vibrio parahaemolyticus TaxID=670 RepID=UPI0022B52F3A|nr:ATP-binding protein [Vibrio parahaemolyticus]MBE5179452.1 ATP-binding protein [Vibrio parahaemolyticus]MCZ6401725.1 ATP-binding protein [Vibrio parahaemolyticus]